MAPLKRWALVTLAGCVALVLAYVPPRGATPSGIARLFMSQSPRGTAARLRTQGLAEEWRQVDGALRVLEQRRRLGGLLPANADRPYVVFSGPTPAPRAAVQLVDSAMQVAWRQLGLGETKIRVAAVIGLAQVSRTVDHPAPEQERMAYLAPDSTDRTTCIVFLPMSRYWTRGILGETPARFAFHDLVQSFKAGFGPCAFYAAYGTPGRPVRQWLAARNWDLALSLNPSGGREAFGPLAWVSNDNVSWYWDAVYAYSPTTVACLAGRAAGCRDAVLIGSSQRGIPMPHVMRLERRWWGVQHLLPGQRYLSDVARAVGRDRFLEFWTSSLPVDTALAAALKRPVGDWTADWERRFVPPPRLGPTAPLGASVFALLITALVVAAVAVTASRRQVR